MSSQVVSPDAGRDFAADIERHVNEFIIHDHEINMPLRLIDTYTGLVVKRSDITSLLQKRQDYRVKLAEAISEASRPIDLECPSPPSKLGHLQAFIAEYLAFAMFSHRWGNREITISDVREATRGIYSIVQAPRHLRGQLVDDFLEGAKKLQEFCCVAAKCGYRWAWADTCCIDDQVFGEKSESLNSMFLWYHSSDLTIVYLGDVDDIGELEERLWAGGSDQWFDDLEIQNPFPPSYPCPPETSDTVVTLHDCSQEESPLQLQTMQPDTQVDAARLEEHIKLNFPTIPGCKVRGKYRNVPAWVTRGWTLQEMLASKRLRFYSKRWTLLEEADDRDTDEAEEKITLSSFKYRARLLDHRLSPIWNAALEDTTEVPARDLVRFEAGAKDVRTRLRWAARRTTTKVEDMAYCLLGIFDVTLPAMYGEGPRAFFRLQEELMKRTADASLFDWCGRSSSVNSFLALHPECFIEPPPRSTVVDSNESPFKMILEIFRAVTGTLASGYLAAIREVKERIITTTKSTPPGHALINGELSLSLFEYHVKSCKRLESATPGDPFCYYKLEADGLEYTNVILKSHLPGLTSHPTRYSLCRVWSRHTQNVFQILLELIEYLLKEKWNEFWKRHGMSSDSESEPWNLVIKDELDELDERDESELKLRDEMQTKRRQVLEFFQDPFPVYLVRVEEGRRVRVNTVNRVLAGYKKFDFALPVVTRLFL